MAFMTTAHKNWDPRFVEHIIDSMADGVFTMDEQGRISSWNRSMERISGYSAAEAIGQTCALLRCSRCFGQNCPADVRRCRIFEQQRSEAKECQLRHKLGHDVPIIKHASVVRDDEGQILGIVETVTDLTELNRARRRAEEATLRLGELHRLDNIIGKSEPMRAVFGAIEAAAASDVTVIIEGESGTGKELVAGAIHYHSGRKAQPLVTVNCSALSETLLESELFGHVRGAYTGAVRDRAGRFEEAAGGTIFLDEIGDLTPLIQVKLLRVLQEREIERVGESRRRPLDIRVITATHHDLAERVRSGVFRQDLFYRLHVFSIALPALRQRREDIPLLTSHFINRFNEKTGKQIVDVAPAVMRLFLDYDWPGNVRQLEHAVEHAFVLCRGDRIEVDDLPLEIRQTPVSGAGGYREASSTPSRHRAGRPDREHLLHLLAACAWNKAEVARQLGVSRTAIWKYMKKYTIPLKPQ
ncbi:hypothetical protein DPPLL_27360 [Desulfofustis limnaeus]|uniref:PAS domain S-box protein n=2 Tax=Desulfofustis limnaeus TaxID=2740163 RepID=A0ABM7WBU3_9BACT|nr:hypothetical protein DPPLL_27360 [Desulfofustis limnaeus]